MVELTEVDIFVIYLMPLSFLIFSWIFERIIDKDSLIKTIFISTPIFSFVNIFGSFMILKKPLWYIIVSVSYWAFITITFFLFNLKNEDKNAWIILIFGYGAIIIFQYYQVIDLLFY